MSLISLEDKNEGSRKGSLSGKGNRLGGFVDRNSDDEFANQLVLPSFINPAFERNLDIEASSSADKRASSDHLAPSFP